MKIRIAEKIIRQDSDRHTGGQKQRAEKRFAQAYRRSNQFWGALMAALGASGRAALLAGWGKPRQALELLMATPESEWNGNSTEFNKIMSRKRD